MIVLIRLLVHFAMALHAEKNDVGITPLTPQSLVKSMSASILSIACGSFLGSGFIQMMKFEPRLSTIPAMLAGAAVHVEGFLAKFSPVKAPMLAPGIVVLPRLFKMFRTKMLSVHSGIIAVAACASGSRFMVRGEGVL